MTWQTFSTAANDASMSRQYGEIHFRQGDLASWAVGRQVWLRATLCFTGVCNG
jgi:hypothetical protein